MQSAGGPEVRYNAFISYSHAADDALAPAVQDGLQALGRPWNKRRALEVFRDDTGLAVNPGLWTSIEAGLDASDHFVLLASPDAAESAWVNREIERWVANHSVERLLPVLTAGEWVWDPDAGDFDWSVSTAVPRALRGVLTEEPRHLDLRWARSHTDLDLRNSRFRDAIAQIAAPMHDLAPQDLESADVRQHRLRPVARCAAVSALARRLGSQGLVLAVRSSRAGGAHGEGAGRSRTPRGQSSRPTGPWPFSWSPRPRSPIRRRRSWPCCCGRRLRVRRRRGVGVARRRVGVVSGPGCGA